MRKTRHSDTSLLVATHDMRGNAALQVGDAVDVFTLTAVKEENQDDEEDEDGGSATATTTAAAVATAAAAAAADTATTSSSSSSSSSNGRPEETKGGAPEAAEAAGGRWFAAEISKVRTELDPGSGTMKVESYDVVYVQPGGDGDGSSSSSASCDPGRGAAGLRRKRRGNRLQERSEGEAGVDPTRLRPRERAVGSNRSVAPRRKRLTRGYSQSVSNLPGSVVYQELGDDGLFRGVVEKEVADVPGYFEVRMHDGQVDELQWFQICKLQQERPPLVVEGGAEEEAEGGGEGGEAGEGGAGASSSSDSSDSSGSSGSSSPSSSSSSSSTSPPPPPPAAPASQRHIVTSFRGYTESSFAFGLARGGYRLQSTLHDKSSLAGSVQDRLSSAAGYNFGWRMGLLEGAKSPPPPVEENPAKKHKAEKRRQQRRQQRQEQRVALDTDGRAPPVLALLAVAGPLAVVRCDDSADAADPVCQAKHGQGSATTDCGLAEGSSGDSSSSSSSSSSSTMWFVCEENGSVAAVAGLLGLSGAEVAKWNRSRLGLGLTLRAKLRALTPLRLPPHFSAAHSEARGFTVLDETALVAMAAAAVVEEVNWAQCDACGKWRQLPPGLTALDESEEGDDAPWYCSMNLWQDPARNRCDAPEDLGTGGGTEGGTGGGTGGGAAAETATHQTEAAAAAAAVMTTMAMAEPSAVPVEAAASKVEQKVEPEVDATAAMDCDKREDEQEEEDERAIVEEILVKDIVQDVVLKALAEEEAAQAAVAAAGEARTGTAGFVPIEAAVEASSDPAGSDSTRGDSESSSDSANDQQAVTVEEAMDQEKEPDADKRGGHHGEEEEEAEVKEEAEEEVEEEAAPEFKEGEPRVGDCVWYDLAATKRKAADTNSSINSSSGSDGSSSSSSSSSSIADEAEDSSGGGGAVTGEERMEEEEEEEEEWVEATVRAVRGEVFDVEIESSGGTEMVEGVGKADLQPVEYEQGEDQEEDEDDEDEDGDEDDDYPRPDLVVTFGLFDSGGKHFPYYRICALRNVASFVEYGDDVGRKVRFVAHVDHLVDDTTLLELHSAARGRLTPVRYSMSQPVSSKTCWLISAMRYRVLWETDTDETVVSVDIHDDSKIQQRQLEGLERKLHGVGKQIAFTYWKAGGSVCENESAVAVRVQGGTHAHTDGGMLVWKAGPARRQVREAASAFHGGMLHGKPLFDFASFVEQQMRACSHDQIRGCDEMMLDAFLKGHLDPSTILWQPHSHSIRTLKHRESTKRRRDGADELGNLDKPGGGWLEVGWRHLDIGDGRGLLLLCCPEHVKRVKRGAGKAAKKEEGEGAKKAGGREEGKSGGGGGAGEGVGGKEGKKKRGRKKGKG